MRGDGDVGVDAQGAGEDRGGDFGGGLEESGAAGLVGVNADLVQPLCQLGGADRASELAAGEEPWRRAKAPIVAWPLRFVATARASVATGSGNWTGGRSAQQLVETLVDETASALTGVRIVGIAAGWAGVPDLRGGAVCAKGLVERAGDDRRDASAGRARC
ncbi:hypothetical protein GCM10011583_34170 [Streptomyces camponoticapitis]|uniref:Uncharacterized protein n=1 Tax=Streptomyces camponoticapitis TaxID=1616125 RepID=A0ABQ2E940_9ACTN|nr:hypothetical protein GCM10011583_34170 [Streptomyces camponoticapitis]